MDKCAELEFKYASIDLNKAFSGKELIELLKDSIDYNLCAFVHHIKMYNKQNLFDMTSRMIRGNEEYINMMFELKPEEFRDVREFPIIDIEHVNKLKPTIDKLNRILTNRFKEPKLVGRLINIYIQLCSLKTTFNHAGIYVELDDILDSIIYLQQRRIYTHAFLGLICKYCEGHETLEPTEPMMICYPEIEINLLGMGIFYDKLTTIYCLDDFSIEYRGAFPNLTAISNFEYNPIEGFFLTPQRMPLLEALEHLPEGIKEIKIAELPTNKIFSYDESMMLGKILKEAYNPYGLDKYYIFNQFLKLFDELKPYILHDYYINTPKHDLKKKIKKIFGNDAIDKIYDSLVVPQDNFDVMLNSKSPFYHIQGRLYSNINFLNRFLMYVAEEYLNKNKKYQIRSGFVFEKIVSKTLEKYGFEIKNIKRLENEHATFSEFDVITVKDEIIYNFQCKNNLIDISDIKIDNIKFKNQNNTLIRLYNDALHKEYAREHLIKEELQKSQIKHIVLSRYPIITRQPNIITFQNLEEWLTNKEYINLN